MTLEAKMDNDNFYIYGMQRSGTNYLEQLLKSNFPDCKMINPGKIVWKHAIDAPTQWNNNQYTFIIHKNPYTWVESMCFRNRMDWIETQKTYPADELHLVDMLNVEGANIINLAKTWKHFHNTWLFSEKTKGPKRLVIRYEDLLNDNSRSAILSTIAHMTEWSCTKPAGGDWHNIEAGKAPQSPDFDKKRLAYYQKQYPEKLNEFQINAITQEIEPHMIQQIGYEVL